MSAYNNGSRTLGSILAATSLLHGRKHVQDAKPISNLASTSMQPVVTNALPLPEDGSKQVSMPNQPADEASAKPVVEDQWQKAYSMLSRNPKLMNTSVLCMALKRHAPLPLVYFMLELDPESASIPKHGPSPLQVAVQSFCSVDVVRAIVEKCPLALVVTNPGSYLDPLSYAKRFRSTESDLIRVLSRPVSDWIDSNTTNPKALDDGSVDDNTKMQKKSIGLKSRLQEAADVRKHPFTKTNPSLLSLVAKSKRSEELELKNVKEICMSVIKSHKRLAKEMLSVQKQVKEIVVPAFPPKLHVVDETVAGQQTLSSVDVARMLQANSMSLIKRIQDYQDKMVSRQLAALDAKEKSMVAHVRNMENRVAVIVRNNKDEMTAKLEKRLNVVANILRTRLQCFMDRVDGTELQSQTGLLNNTGKTVTLASNAEHRQFAKWKKSGLVIDTTVDSLSPYTSATSPSSFTYRSDNTYDSGPDTTPRYDDTPILFATPHTKPTSSDELTSLLTSEVFVQRPSHYYRSSRRAWPWSQGKRSRILFCKS